VAAKPFTRRNEADLAPPKSADNIAGPTAAHRQAVRADIVQRANVRMV
jgi:hypothetical protein